MRSDLPNPTPDPASEIDSELVAYLDHELDAEGRQRVERRLSTDAAYQRRLRELQRVWDLLDELPRSAPDDRFTQSTVEMVAIAAEQDVREATAVEQRRRSYSWVGLVFGCLLAALFGYVVVSSRLARPDRELLRDFPLLNHLSTLRHAESVAFLSQLRAAGVFPTDDDGEAEPVPESATAEDVRSLSAAEKELLRQAKEQFDRLSDKERDRLRSLHEELVGHSDGAELWRTARSFDDWVRQQSAAERAELLALPNDERIARMIEQEQKRRQAFRLPPEDSDRLRKWLDEFIERHEAEYLAALPDDAQAWLRRTSDPVMRRRQMMLAVMARAKLGPGKQRLPLPEQRDLLELRERLSEPTQREMDRIPKEKWPEVVNRWVRDALEFRGRLSAVDHAELRRFFTSLPIEKQQELEQLSPDAMQRELRALFTQRFPPPDRSGTSRPRSSGPFRRP